MDSLHDLKRKALEQRLADLHQEYQTIHAQLAYTLDEVTGIKIRRRIQALESEMSKIQGELEQLSRRTFDTESRQTPLLDVEQDRQFVAGARLRDIREELSLRPSQFVEVIGYTSEAQYRRLESDDLECPESVLANVHQSTGACLEWLKHGLGPKYEVEELHIDRLGPDEAVDVLTSSSLEWIFVTLEKRNFEIGIYVLLNKQRYKVYSLDYFTMDLWNWIDDLYFIPQLYDFFKTLTTRCDREVCGREISPGDSQKLYSGSIHPSGVTRIRNTKMHWWVHHIVDIEHAHGPVSGYRRMYGEWFVQAQDVFRECLGLAPES